MYLLVTIDFFCNLIPYHPQRPFSIIYAFTGGLNFKAFVSHRTTKDLGPAEDQREFKPWEHQWHRSISTEHAVLYLHKMDYKMLKEG